MFISLPDRTPTDELSEELALAIKTLDANGVAAVFDVTIILRALNLDERECYPADASGKHDMGFTIYRPEPELPSIRRISWKLPGMNPKPVEHDGLRGLWDLFPGAEEKAEGPR